MPPGDGGGGSRDTTGGHQSVVWASEDGPPIDRLKLLVVVPILKLAPQQRNTFRIIRELHGVDGLVLCMVNDLPVLSPSIDSSNQLAFVSTCSRYLLEMM